MLQNYFLLVPLKFFIYIKSFSLSSPPQSSPAPSCSSAFQSIGASSVHAHWELAHEQVCYEKGNNRKLREDKSKGRNQVYTEQNKDNRRVQKRGGRSVKLAFNSVEREWGQDMQYVCNQHTVLWDSDFQSAISHFVSFLIQIVY